MWIAFLTGCVICLTSKAVFILSFLKELPGNWKPFWLQERIRPLSNRDLALQRTFLPLHTLTSRWSKRRRGCRRRCTGNPLKRKALDRRGLSSLQAKKRLLGISRPPSEWEPKLIKNRTAPSITESLLLLITWKTVVRAPVNRGRKSSRAQQPPCHIPAQSCPRLVWNAIGGSSWKDALVGALHGLTWFTDRFPSRIDPLCAAKVFDSPKLLSPFESPRL